MQYRLFYARVDKKNIKKNKGLFEKKKRKKFWTNAKRSVPDKERAFKRHKSAAYVVVVVRASSFEPLSTLFKHQIAVFWQSVLHRVNGLTPLYEPFRETFFSPPLIRSRL